MGRNNKKLVKKDEELSYESSQHLYFKDKKGQIFKIKMQRPATQDNTGRRKQNKSQQIEKKNLNDQLDAMVLSKPFVDTKTPNNAFSDKQSVQGSEQANNLNKTETPLKGGNNSDRIMRYSTQQQSSSQLGDSQSEAKYKEFGQLMENDSINFQYMMGKYTKNTNQSIYTKDFNSRQKMNDLPCITMDFWTSKYKWPSMGTKSTNNTDFISHSENNKIFKKVHPEVRQSEFIGNSTYKNNFGAHTNVCSSFIEPIVPQTVIPGLQFNGHTMYNDNYTGVSFKPDPFDMEIKNKFKKKFKSPFNPQFPFLGYTTNGKTYQPFKTNVQLMSKPTALQERSDPRDLPKPSPSFKGQFKSTQQQDYQHSDKHKHSSPSVLNQMKAQYKSSLYGSKYHSVNKSQPPEIVEE